MKDAVYQVILEKFDAWSSRYDRVCSKGCSTCCSQNVTITALEGEKILSYVRTAGLSFWMADKLCRTPSPNRPRMTTNEFAHAYLNGREADPGEYDSISPCPFLEEHSCMIYPVRPFSCRCFISAEHCSTSRPARVEECYLSASTAMMQLIEHMGQKEYWGNMLDVLLALCDMQINSQIAERLDNPARIMQARLRTHSARPLPGFLFTEEDVNVISPLLADLFATRINGRSIEDFLNGK